jgi:hypothetical protein
VRAALELKPVSLSAGFLSALRLAFYHTCHHHFLLKPPAQDAEGNALAGYFPAALVIA